MLTGGLVNRLQHHESVLCPLLLYTTPLLIVSFVRFWPALKNPPSKRDRPRSVVPLASQSNHSRTEKTVPTSYLSLPTLFLVNLDRNFSLLSPFLQRGTIIHLTPPFFSLCLLDCSRHLGPPGSLISVNALLWHCFFKISIGKKQNAWTY